MLTLILYDNWYIRYFLQVFSKQALMMDTLIEHFAGEYRKRLGQETPSDHANYADYHSGMFKPIAFFAF